MGSTSLYRRTLLTLAGTRPLQGFLRRHGMRLGVSRFVAGETLPEALITATELERAGFLVILDRLGEFVDRRDLAAATAEQLRSDVNEAAGVLSSAALSVKPTQLGLAIDRDFALSNARMVAQAAAATGARLCLDMESHEYVDGTLWLYRRLREEGFDGVGTVLQSYLRRSEADLQCLLEDGDRVTLRIVKGAYQEPADVAFSDKRVVDRQFMRLVLRLLQAGGRAEIASHDERLLRAILDRLEGFGPQPGSFELQMLYGVRPALQRRLLNEGHPLRIYLPYGDDWYGYFSRRLAERPANLFFVLRGLAG